MIYDAIESLAHIIIDRDPLLLLSPYARIQSGMIRINGIYKASVMTEKMFKAGQRSL